VAAWAGTWTSSPGLDIRKSNEGAPEGAPSVLGWLVVRGYPRQRNGVDASAEVVATLRRAPAVAFTL